MSPRSSHIVPQITLHCSVRRDAHGTGFIIGSSSLGNSMESSWESQPDEPVVEHVFCRGPGTRLFRMAMDKRRMEAADPVAKDG